MAWLALGVGLVVVWAYALAATFATLRFGRRPIRARDGAMPPVTVLKPLYGAEPGLYENLLSFADQEHPEHQIICGVRDRTDLAIPVARQVMADRPASDFELVIDPRVTGS